jgi:hypothetical protein
MVAAAPETASRPVPAPEAPRCRNCGAAADGAYCPACGQETRLALPTARQFLKDAAGRYVALDGRTWRTLHALLLRPGFLTLEYFAGRRRRYLRPSRLFLVLSLAMFATIRVVVGVQPIDEDAVLFQSDAPAPQAPARTEAAGDASGASGAAGADKAPATADKVAAARDKVAAAAEKVAAAGNKGVAGSSKAAPEAAKAASGHDEAIILTPGIGLRVNERGDISVDGDGPVATAIRDRLKRFNALPRQDRIEQLVLGMVRYGPYAMFALLPAFALLLQVLYTGRRLRHPARPRRYAEHLVFAAHNHAFVFLLVTLSIVVHWGPATLALLAWAAVYGLRSMKAVYGGRWLGVFARAWAIGVSYLVLFAFVTVGLFLAALLLR